VKKQGLPNAIKPKELGNGLRLNAMTPCLWPVRIYKKFCSILKKIIVSSRSALDPP
jgi:hypothetical protein